MQNKCKRCRELENEIVLMGMVLVAIERIIDGKEASDFEESFSIVRKVIDFRAGIILAK